MRKSRAKQGRSSDFDISIIPYSEVPTKSFEKPAQNGTKHVRRRPPEEPQITPMLTLPPEPNEDQRHIRRNIRQRAASNSSDRRQQTNIVIAPVENRNWSNPTVCTTNREHHATVVDSVTAYRYLSESNPRKKSRSRRLISNCFSCRCFRR